MISLSLRACRQTAMSCIQVGPENGRVPQWACVPFAVSCGVDGVLLRDEGAGGAVPVAAWAARALAAIRASTIPAAGHAVQATTSRRPPGRAGLPDRVVPARRPRVPACRLTHEISAVMI